jgi:hypothetical protein
MKSKYTHTQFKEMDKTNKQITLEMRKTNTHRFINLKSKQNNYIEVLDLNT